MDVLGYTLNLQPGFNLTTEYKNEKDSKKADGAILKGGAVRAVIELKGTNTTDLAKIAAQAFGYLHNQKGCTYVITSNFEKLRFYIQMLRNTSSLTCLRWAGMNLTPSSYACTPAACWPMCPCK